MSTTCQSPATRTTSTPTLDVTADVIDAAQQGHPDGWTALHNSVRARVSSLVNRYAGRQLLLNESADDLVAEVLLRMFKSLPRLDYRGQVAFQGWISRLVQNTLAARASYHGARKRGPPPLRLTSPDSDEGISEQSVPSPMRGPVAAVQWLDERTLLMGCIQQLGGDDQRFVERLLTHGLDMQAIGKALGISSDAARMRWVRLRCKLRGMVGRGGVAA